MKNEELLSKMLYRLFGIIIEAYIENDDNKI